MLFNEGACSGLIVVSRIRYRWAVAQRGLSGCGCGAVYTCLPQLGQCFGLERFIDKREKQALLPLEMLARSRQRGFQKLPPCCNTIPWALRLLRSRIKRAVSPPSSPITLRRSDGRHKEEVTF